MVSRWQHLFTPAYPQFRCTTNSIAYSMVMWSLLESESAVAAWTWAWFIEVDVNFGVTEWPSSAITNCLSSIHYPHGFTGDHFHGAQRRRLKFHHRLFESWTFRCNRPWTLRSRPCRWVVWCLLLGVGDCRWW